ncbi:MAG: NUDIX hydrolase [Anaerolineales bacterium]|nr:NUDIX hydrolase [Anaerolineales bacterium]MCX7754182.1 NUDIX hydrolase [Anaerolineales bacterium]MDW8276968.1 NUDIX hydrolase [Anaerolineales bacterium]
MKPWKTLSRELVLDFSRFLAVERHTVELPDGRIIENWPWVVIPEFVDVLPVLEDGRLLVMRQFKYGVGEVSLSTMGGMIDAGETPEQAARREMYEEMGCEAREMVFLGKYAADANRRCGTAHLFLALGARPVTEPHSGDLEEQEIVPLTREEARRAMLNGEFKMLSWTATLGLALAWLDQHFPESAA